MELTNISLAALNNLSEEERAAAIKILQEYALEGKSDLLEELKYADFAEVPVDIETFIHEKQYLGNGLYDQEGRFTVYPFWEKKLTEIFPDNVTTAYNNIVFTGAIGIGKSTIAVIILLYMLYRLLCLKNPYVYYGLQEIDKLTISLMNITLDNARGVAMDKMNQLILSSDWFMAHGEMAGTTNLIYRPEKHIEIVCASSNNQIIGRAVFCLAGDTLIKTESGYKQLEDLCNTTIRVISVDENGNEVASNPCTVLPTVKTTEEYQIELEDGTVIKCTPNHKLMLKDGTYKEAQYLTESDELAEVQTTYNEFSNNIIKTRGQWALESGFEGHHIVPKCLGGEGGTKTKHPNIIRLTPKEHFIAHKLLALENQDNKSLVGAWEMMAYLKGKTKRTYEISAEDYEILRKLWSNHMTKSNPGLCKNGHPWNYGTGIKKQKSFIFINDGTVNQKIKPTDPIPDGFVKGRAPARPRQLLTKEQKYLSYSSRVCGNKNPMYKNGYRVSGGNNGHAISRYFIDDKIFECGKDLISYLKPIDSKISASTIRKWKQGSQRVLKEHPILKTISWELK